MKNRFISALIVLFVTLFVACDTDAQTTSNTENTTTIGLAVAELQALLSSSQQNTLSFDFNDSIRSNWSNLPDAALDRNGIRMGDLDATQLAAVFKVLETALSSKGYALVKETMLADDYLAAAAGSNNRAGWSSDNYYFAVFGEPSDADIWGWQFGGHHLAVNMTYKGDSVVLSPTLLAIEPSNFEDSGQSYAPMQSYVDAGLAVINGLDASTQAASTVANRPNELYTGARSDGVIPTLEGAVIGNWTTEQQNLVLTLINEWVSVLPEAAATARLAEIKADFASTYFAWNGSTDGSDSFYFRVQGPNLIVEFSTQGAVGAAAGEGHYHSMYRNPNNEYGSALQ